MPIAAELLQLLVHPLRKTPLQYREQDNVLTDASGTDVFPIREQVPILLTGSPDTELTHTGMHDREGTSFQYREHYQNDAAAYDYTEESPNNIERQEIRRLRQTIVTEVPPKGWILDVGCGGAWLAKQLVPKGRRVISMDISDINPIKALRQTPATNHAAVVADVYALPFSPGSIDCIVASEIIEHVPDPKTFLSHLYQVLRPGGRLIVTTPYNELIRTSLCIHCNRLTPHNAHLHSFTEDSFRRILPAGIKGVRTRVFNNKLLVKTQLQWLLRFLPFSQWAIIDRLALNITGKKAYRLMVVLEK